MKTRVFIPVLVAAAAGALQAQQSGGRQMLQMDGIVAVVGSKPILWSEVQEQLLQERARGAQLPDDSAGAVQFARTVIQQMIDEQVLLQRAANDTALHVADEDLKATVDQQIAQVRGQFPLGAGVPAAAPCRGLRLDGGVPPVHLGPGPQGRAAASARAEVPGRGEDDQGGRQRRRRERGVRARQGHLPEAPAGRDVPAGRRADHGLAGRTRAGEGQGGLLLKEIQGGAEFEQVARRASDDSASAAQGGDLGWARRGELVTAFEDMMFRLPPGQVSPPVLTQYGYHIIKVERAKPSEVKARHILIKPTYSAADSVLAHARADSVLRMWQSGTPFDTLVKRYHDPDEEEGMLEPFPKEQLPESYRAAIGDAPSGTFIGPFPIADRGRGMPKYVVLQLTDVVEAGEYTVEEVRDRMRTQLSQERSFRRLLDQLKGETYVRVFPIEQYLQRP